MYGALVMGGRGIDKTARILLQPSRFSISGCSYGPCRGATAPPCTRFSIPLLASSHFQMPAFRIPCLSRKANIRRWAPAACRPGAFPGTTYERLSVRLAPGRLGTVCHRRICTNCGTNETRISGGIRWKNSGVPAQANRPTNRSTNFSRAPNLSRAAPDSTTTSPPSRSGCRWKPRAARVRFTRLGFGATISKTIAEQPVCAAISL